VPVSDRQQLIEKRYAQAERKNELRKAATVRRGPTSLIAVCIGVSLLVGITAAIDLRRLHTPEGTALAWTGAAVFGDCTAYRELTWQDGERDGELDDDECRRLRRVTESARDRPADVEIELLEAAEEGERATARMRVRLPEEDPVEVPLSMRRRGGGWAVEPGEQTCEVLACP
jgi:hypothetical protein